ncbi:MAG: protein jag [Minisyncoccia bacterium]
MDKVQKTIEKMFDLMGFDDKKIIVDENYRKISIFINDEFVRRNVANLIGALEHIVNLIISRNGIKGPYIIDLNYYRKEREKLIIELAKAAAKKALLNKESVDLPPMNAYERRLVHLEIISHPELKTESIGEGKNRHVVIKHI